MKKRLKKIKRNDVMGRWDCSCGRTNIGVALHCGGCGNTVPKTGPYRNGVKVGKIGNSPFFLPANPQKVNAEFFHILKNLQSLPVAMNI